MARIGISFSPLLAFSILLSSFTGAYGRLSPSILITGSSDLRPDGRWAYIPLPNAAEEACEQTYGVLPCTRSVIGNLFLLLVYGYLMLIGATYLSDGCDRLLGILGPGIVGGIFLPMLGSLPDAILIFVSGISGSKETAQQQVLIGMGLLAGSTVMLLTVLWGSCVVVGKCDFSEDSNAIDQQDTKRFSLFGSGLSTDVQTSHAAKIMVISIIPFIILQFPRIFNFSYEGEWIVLVALVLSLALLMTYCLYQIYQPWILKQRYEYTRNKYLISSFLRHAQQHARGIGQLLTEDGLPDEVTIQKLFQSIDTDSNNMISRSELTALMVGIHFDNAIDYNDIVNRVMLEFDTSHDENIQLGEFKAGVEKWLNEAKKTVPYLRQYAELADDFHMQTRQEHDTLIGGNHDDNGEEDKKVGSKDSPMWIWIKAISLLSLGASIAAVFADPLVDAMDNFSSATHISPFFISFILMPLATNSSEAVSAIIFASRKKQKMASLTFSEIYGSATMNNTMCLSVFLALVYSRHLTWDFSSEVLVIILVCVIMGLFASTRTSLPLWTSVIAFLLYPSSLLLVFVLNNVLGWS